MRQLIKSSVSFKVAIFYKIGKDSSTKLLVPLNMGV